MDPFNVNLTTGQRVSPDWGATSGELICPLCDYNLRGLVEPRCPECGFRFQWDELIDAQQYTHRYLFEHHPRRNVWSFCKTFLNDCLPRRFWKQLNPAHPVRVRRMAVYWLLANSILLLAMIGPFAKTGKEILRQNIWAKRAYIRLPNGSYQFTTYDVVKGAFVPEYNVISAAQYRRAVPPPWSWELAVAIWTRTAWNSLLFDAVVVVLLWPWITLLSLMIFQASMRRAKIRVIHVVRCVVYGCDFALLAVTIMMACFRFPHDEEELCLLFALMCCVPVATYRLTMAYKYYLRFDHPGWTILASQFVVALAVLTAILNLFFVPF